MHPALSHQPAIPPQSADKSSSINELPCVRHATLLQGEAGIFQGIVFPSHDSLPMLTVVCVSIAGSTTICQYTTKKFCSGGECARIIAAWSDTELAVGTTIKLRW